MHPYPVYFMAIKWYYASTSPSIPSVQGLLIRSDTWKWNILVPDLRMGGSNFVWWQPISSPLQWRHNEHTGVSNHQPRDSLLNRLFGRRSRKTSKIRVTGLFAGNSPVTGEFPAQMASNAENVSIWWRSCTIAACKMTNSLRNTVETSNTAKEKAGFSHICLQVSVSWHMKVESNGRYFADDILNVFCR